MHLLNPVFFPYLRPVSQDVWTMLQRLGTLSPSFRETVMTNRKGFLTQAITHLSSRDKGQTGFPSDDFSPSYCGPNAPAAVMQALKLCKVLLIYPVFPKTS